MTADVIDLDRRIKPNLRRCFEVVDIAGNNQAVLFIAVMGALSRVDKLKYRESGNRLKSAELSVHDLKEIADMLTVAFLALATILGIPRSDLADLDLGPAS